MRACACLAIAIPALAGCASDGSAERSASFSAETAVRSYCAGIAVTPEDHADCLASRWARNECSGIGAGYGDCIAAQHSAVRGECGVHVVFSKYADCVAIGENRIGGWPPSGNSDE
jgi:hypothetical protein